MDCRDFAVSHAGGLAWTSVAVYLISSLEDSSRYPTDAEKLILIYMA